MTTPIVVPENAGAVVRRRARIVRYGAWQFRDFVMERGAGLFVIGIVLGYLTVAPMLPSMHRKISMLPPNPKSGVA